VDDNHAYPKNLCQTIDDNVDIYRGSCLELSTPLAYWDCDRVGDLSCVAQDVYRGFAEGSHLHRLYRVWGADQAVAGSVYLAFLLQD
jgi:hypothetical protein